MLEVGRVVKSKAGRDKNRFFCIVECALDSVKIADGKTHRLEKPKRKNTKHIQATTTKIELDTVTDKQLRILLKPLNDGLKAGCETQRGR